MPAQTQSQLMTSLDTIVTTVLSKKIIYQSLKKTNKIWEVLLHVLAKSYMWKSSYMQKDQVLLVLFEWFFCFEDVIFVIKGENVQVIAFIYLLDCSLFVRNLRLELWIFKCLSQWNKTWTLYLINFLVVLEGVDPSSVNKFLYIF